MPFFGLFGHRYVITLMGFLGNFFSYTMRLTVNFALVEMVQHPADNSSSNSIDTCPLDLHSLKNSSIYKEGDFSWTSEEEGTILGAFYYGYLMTQIPTGFLATHISPKMLFGCGMGASGLLTLLAPVAARHSYQTLVGIRLLMGLAQGICFPLLPAIYGRWAPPQERTKMLAINSAGVQAGTVTAYIVCGKLGDDSNLGWEAMFYLFGTLGLFFTIPWMMFVFDSPEQHPTISGEEKSYIISSIGAPAMGAKPTRVPWAKILRSRPFWALIVVCWCSDWGFYTLLSDVPLYLRDNLHFTLKDNSQQAAMPYLTMLIVVLLLCPVADLIISRNILSVTNLRKATTIFGSIAPGILLICIPYAGCGKDGIIALLCMSIGLSGVASLGFRVNFNDISPSHAGLLYGLANTLSTTTGFIGPLVTGILTPGALTNTISAWKRVFVIAAALYFFAALVYGLFASGELQDWDQTNTMKYNEVAPEIQMEAAGIDRKERRRRSSIPAWIPPPTPLKVPALYFKESNLLERDKNVVII